MLDSLRKLFSGLTGDAGSARRFEETDYRLAATALLVHLMAVDGTIAETERTKLQSLVETRFSLSPEEAAELVREATIMEGDAVDLYRFTSLIMRSVDEEGRLRIVEMMWELVFADGKVNEFEDNVIWRAADLLGISTRQRIELRRRVGASFPDTPTPNP
jgi:uncharacterized tellurite resistance protein B-like protein